MGRKNIQFVHARSWPFTRVHASTYGAIFSKNRFLGTTHGDKPTSQNGISLRSPSLIMAPDDTLLTAAYETTRVWGCINLYPANKCTSGNALDTRCSHLSTGTRTFCQRLQVRFV